MGYTKQDEWAAAEKRWASSVARGGPPIEPFTLGGWRRRHAEGLYLLTVMVTFFGGLGTLIWLAVAYGP